MLFRLAMKYITFVAALIFSCFCVPSYAQDTFSDRIYNQMVSDTNALMQDYEVDKIVYINNKLPRYKEVMQEVCNNNNSVECPKLKFTNLNIVGASIYPNGIMLINEEAVNRLSYSQISFVLAQQFNLFKTNAAKQRAQALAAYLTLLNIEVTPQKALSIQGLVPELIVTRTEIEKSAFLFAFDYIEKQNLHINCMEMMEQLINDSEKFKNDSKAISQRCNIK
jgi:hypothetical protein